MNLLAFIFVILFLAAAILPTNGQLVTQKCLQSIPGFGGDHSSLSMMLIVTDVVD